MQDFDKFVSSGVCEPSMCEFIMHLLRLRRQIPKDVFVRQPHILRNSKTGDENLPKGVRPRVQIFPYRSNSKKWALFFLERDEAVKKLRCVMLAETYEPEAFEWAVNHFRHKFDVKDIEQETWPSSQGHELFLFLGFTKMLFPEMDLRTSDYE